MSTPTAGTTDAGNTEASATSQWVGRRVLVLPVLASVLCLALAAPAIPALSPTIDEALYVSEGVKSWYGNSDHLIPMGVLPLFSWAQNAPGALYLKLQYGGLPKGPNTNIAGELETADQLVLIRLARAVNLLWSGLGTIWSVWWVGLRWVGPRAAGVAALFAAIEPNLLASYALATTDAPILPFTLLAMAAFDSYMHQRSLMRLLLVAALIGLGTALKVSVLPMGLLLIGSCLVARVWASSASALNAVRRLVLVTPRFLFEVAAIVAVALAVSWAANGLLMGHALEPGGVNRVVSRVLATMGCPETQRAVWIARFQSTMVPGPLSVLRSQLAHSRGGHGMMFRGRVGNAGPVYYYPYVFALKTHLVMLVLGFVALVTRDVRRSPLPLAALLIFALSCTTKLHQGPRYFLVLYTVWAVLAGAGAIAMLDRIRQGLVRNLAAAVLAAASLALTLTSAPDYLTHASPLWGGDWEGYRYVDANFDWGQGAFSAFAAADAKGLSPVSYFSTGSPFMGIARNRDMIGYRDFAYADELPPRLEYVEETLARLRGRIIAVPLRCLYGPLPHEAVVPIFRGLRAEPPTGRLTKEYVYYDLRDPERFAALELTVRREIPYWVQEFQDGRNAGMVALGPFSADPRAPRADAAPALPVRIGR
jgi:hypothetical protein